jgi:hypothetical protein
MSSLRPRAIDALLSVAICLQPLVAHSQGSGACSYLNLELAKQVSGPLNEYVFELPPEEEPAGAGSACFYADIVLQIDAFSAEFIEQTGEAGEGGWKPLNDVGDRAYFRDNRGSYAEIISSVGTRTFTIQLGVPSGSTVEAMKPKAITLANAIVVKLK